MNKAQKIFLGILMAVAGLGTLHAIYPDPEYIVGRVLFMANGVVKHTIADNSTGQLLIGDAALGNVAVFDNTDGSLLLRTRTSTQLSTLVPTAANELVMNSSVPALCVSTGTGAGAWVMMSTNTAPVSKAACFGTN